MSRTLTVNPDRLARPAPHTRGGVKGPGGGAPFPRPRGAASSLGGPLLTEPHCAGWTVFTYTLASSSLGLFPEPTSARHFSFSSGEPPGLQRDGRACDLDLSTAPHLPSWAASCAVPGLCSQKPQAGLARRRGGPWSACRPRERVQGETGSGSRLTLEAQHRREGWKQLLGGSPLPPRPLTRLETRAVCCLGVWCGNQGTRVTHPQASVSLSAFPSGHTGLS